PNEPITIPVCYHRQLAPHLEEVAMENKMSVAEFVRVHSSETYYVSFLGFGEGVPFLGGVNKELTAPKKNSLELYVPYGSVGITSTLTGHVPIDAVSDWKVIVKCSVPTSSKPARFFTPNR